MIKLIQGSDASSHPELFEQMYRMRARIFGERLGWDVSVVNGQERDEFDDCNPLYGLALSASGRDVVGCFRLLQTTGPTMLGTVFRELLPPDLSIRSPLVWESTRFCVDTDRATELAEHGLNNITGRLLAAVYETGMYVGLTHVVTVIDVRMERVMRRAGCPMERLAPPKRIGKVDTVATLVPTDEAAVHSIHERNGILESSLNRDQVHAIAA